MVGNDVVDLSDPDTDPATRHPRFDGRAFSAAERQLLAAEGDSNPLRWRLWAAKEAAYKVARRRDANAVFHPREFEVSVCSRERASVRWQHEVFSVRFESCSSIVHAIAVLEGISMDSTLARCRRLNPGDGAELSPADQSSGARSLAVGALSGWLGVAENRIEIRSREKIPEVWIAGERSDVELSLSHHGHAVAFAARCGSREGVAS
jgi:phosphopantetheinyl transferase (holo-ACP synthase)